MVLLPSEKKVLYLELKGSRYLFADERVKMHLLRLMDEIHQREGWHILAFCVMDDCAYFILEAARITGIARAIQSAARTGLADVFCEVGIRPKDTILTGQTERLKSYPELVDRCREIHRIPLEREKVERLRDYWWSSYSYYAGIRDWEMVDQGPVLMYFSEDIKDARTQFMRLHEPQAFKHARTKTV